MSNKDKKSGGSFVAQIIGVFIALVLLVSLWPKLIAPFKLFEFWHIKGSLLDAVMNAWPIYLWGISATALLAVFRSGVPDEDPGDILIKGTFISIRAGILEEIAFRWLIFFLAIIIIPAIDWALLGFMGVHWVKWLSVFVASVANIFTLGYLEDYLLGGYGWVVAAAVISANSNFRDGHRYLGWLGYVNSWFLGMYFFWVMFTYGIIAAIFIHFLYDFCVFAAAAVATAVAKERRWA
jgi:hypothetical protein